MEFFVDILNQLNLIMVFTIFEQIVFGSQLLVDLNIAIQLNIIVSRDIYILRTNLVSCIKCICDIVRFVIQVVVTQVTHFVTGFNRYLHPTVISIQVINCRIQRSIISNRSRSRQIDVNQYIASIHDCTIVIQTNLVSFQIEHSQFLVYVVQFGLFNGTIVVTAIGSLNRSDIQTVVIDQIIIFNLDHISFSVQLHQRSI